MERLLFCWEKNSLFTSISMAVRINRPLEDVLVFGALRRLLLKYPLLFSALLGEELDVAFGPLEKIYFKDVYLINEEVTQAFDKSDEFSSVLTSVFAHQNHKKGTPLWKLVYYKNIQWFSFHCSHAISDGGSVISYLKEFVENLNHVTETSVGEILFSLSEDLPFLQKGISPGILEMVNFKPDLYTRLKANSLKFIVQIWPGFVKSVVDRRRHNLFFVDRPPKPYSKQTFFESEYVADKNSPLNFTAPSFINISSKDLKSMLQVCRLHNVKLQTYIIMKYVHTMLELYPQFYAEKDLLIAVAVSFRNIFGGFPSHSTYLGNKGQYDDGFYVHVPFYYLPPKSYFSWTTVKLYHDFLHQTVTSKSFVDGYAIACEGMSAEKFMAKKVGVTKDSLFLGNTNLGPIDLIEHNNLKLYQIENVLFVPMPGAFMGTHEMTAISTSKCGLNIGFLKADPNVEDWGVFKKELRLNLLTF